MKKSFKFIISFTLIFLVLSSSLFVFGDTFVPYVNSEIVYGYTSDISSFGFSLNPTTGDRYEEVNIYNESFISGNSCQVKFGYHSHYQGYQLNLRPNKSFKCGIGNLYNVKGSVSVKFQDLALNYPNRLVLYLGIGSDIIYALSSEEILSGINNQNEYIFNIDKDIYASSEETLSQLVVYFYFSYQNTINEDFIVSVSEFRVVPTQGLSYNNVLYDHDIILNNYNPTQFIPFDQKFYNNSSAVLFGSDHMVDEFRYYGMSTIPLVLARGLVYSVSGTATIDFSNHPFPTEVTFSLGEYIPSSNYPELNFHEVLSVTLTGELLEKNRDGNTVTCVFNSVFTVLDYTPNCLFISSNGDDQYITGEDIGIYLSRFSLNHVNPLSADYQSYLSSEDYLLSSLSGNVTSLSFLFDSVIGQMPQLAPSFQFFSFMFNLGFSIPFFNILFYIIGSFSLGALLFGIAYSSARLSRKVSKNKSNKGG